ncbi:hypothetical protein ACIBW9_33470 [Streptomyces sp. NPDC049541]|uniref:hypothetical protein n=1 Tax=Streptomyces sp. NPDC049541 TaxID=3365594 RepID=UPI0037ABAADF
MEAGQRVGEGEGGRALGEEDRAEQPGDLAVTPLGLGEQAAAHHGGEGHGQRGHHAGGHDGHVERGELRRVGTAQFYRAEGECRFGDQPAEVGAGHQVEEQAESEGALELQAGHFVVTSHSFQALVKPSFQRSSRYGL